MLMPDEFTLDLDDLELVVVEPADDLRRPVIGEHRQLLVQVDLVNRHARNCPTLAAGRASTHTPANLPAAPPPGEPARPAAGQPAATAGPVPPRGPRP